MKTYFYMGRNPNNISGVSYKIWRIRQVDRTVTVEWGPASLRGRMPVLTAKPTAKSWRYKTSLEAQEEMKRRIDEKLAKGYQLKPRRRSR